MLGFDTLYRNTCTDDELLIISNHEKRILLSKDRDLLNDTRLMRGYRVRANDPTLQLSEVMRRFDLYTSIMPFQRCLRCNSMLRLVPREEVVHRLPEKVRQSFDEFHYCDTCTRVYWKGGHYHRMQAFIWTLLRQADA
jgi:uncharacterized protein with PIN domain